MDPTLCSLVYSCTPAQEALLHCLFASASSGGDGGALGVSQTEQPVDVFICLKEVWWKFFDGKTGASVRDSGRNKGNQRLYVNENGSERLPKEGSERMRRCPTDAHSRGAMSLIFRDKRCRQVDEIEIFR